MRIKILYPSFEINFAKLKIYRLKERKPGKGLYHRKASAYVTLYYGSRSDFLALKQVACSGFALNAGRDHRRIEMGRATMNGVGCGSYEVGRIQHSAHADFLLKQVGRTSRQSKQRRKK